MKYRSHLSILFILLCLCLAAPAWIAAQPAGTAITVDNAAQVTSLGQLTGHTGPIFSLAFSPDSKSLVSGGSGSDYTAKLWDVATAAERATLQGHTAQIAAVGFSADGNQVLTASYDMTIRTWDTGTGAALETIDKIADTELPPTMSNLNTFFSPDGSKLIYASDGAFGNVFDMAAHTEVELAEVNTDYYFLGASSLAISPDDKTAVVMESNGTLHFIDLESMKETNLIKSDEEIYFSPLAFSPDGKLLAAANSVTSEIQLWDATTGEKGLVLAGHEPNPDGMLGIYGLVFNADGTLLASASYDNTVRIWDVQAGKELIKLDDEGAATVAWSPDGTRLASANLTGVVTLWGIAG